MVLICVAQSGVVAVVDARASKLPVILMHGINAAEGDYQPLKQYCSNSGHQTYMVTSDLGSQSIFSNLHTQLKHLQESIQALKTKYQFREHHLICHSMGALLCRTYLQTTRDHTAQVYISLSGPHMGQFGITKMFEEKIPIFKNQSREHASKLLYDPLVQHYLSVANFWKDPFNYDKYQRAVTFLPVYNNETGVANPLANQFKPNFSKLKKAIFLGSMADEVIEPPFSALFQFWKISPGSSKKYEVVRMQDQEIYKTDLFGLKSMMNEGRLLVTEVPGITHMDWLSKKNIYVNYIEPYLF